MEIHQFEDQSLSHYSYAIQCTQSRQIVLIDPSRDMLPYVDYASKNQAKIIGVIETHAHADFVSAHLEAHQEHGATLYSSKHAQATYPFQPFDDGDTLTFGEITLAALNTPGHSLDSICVLLTHNGQTKAVFTGDTLFLGDCGRPDLGGNDRSGVATRTLFAEQMYESLRTKLMCLGDEVIVYPAHGAGSLCGKSLSAANQSTMGAEKLNNWSLQPMSKQQFIQALTGGQPYVPKYFPYTVKVNRTGAPNLLQSLYYIPFIGPISSLNSKELDQGVLVIDTRPSTSYRASHLPNSINIMQNGKLETWLGSIVDPGEPFYLGIEKEEDKTSIAYRISKIGYEPFLQGIFVLQGGSLTSPELDLDHFQQNQLEFTILDVRNPSEVINQPIFESAISIPLYELRERLSELPTHKPMVVHCAAGYRSAIASSIVRGFLNESMEVYDLGPAIRDFAIKNEVSV